MTKKDFIMLAKVMNNIRPGLISSYAWTEACEAIAIACKESNPAFNRAKFLAACNVDKREP